MKNLVVVLAVLLLVALPLISGCGDDGDGLTEAEKHVYKGNDYFEEGRFDDAIAEYSKAIELDPTNAYFYSMRSWGHSENGDYELAIADLDKAIELEPNNGGFFYNRSDVYRRMGDAARADADLNKARELGYEE